MKPMMGNLETTETIREVSKFIKTTPVVIVSGRESCATFHDALVYSDTN